MANEKFKRIITGLLLSCNVASFSLCSAYNVLTEAVANQSGSEQLRSLYKLGRNIQEIEASRLTDINVTKAKINEVLTMANKKIDN